MSVPFGNRPVHRLLLILWGLLATLGVVLLGTSALFGQEGASSPTAVGSGSDSATNAPADVVVAQLDGPIGPASEQWLITALENAGDAEADALVLELDTPGGLVTSMRVMIQMILDADVPVLMYVSPRGARAASAGTYLLYASHVAAMSPGTNLGAATPVSIGGGFGDAPEETPEDTPSDSPDEAADPADNTDPSDSSDGSDAADQSESDRRPATESASPPPPSTAMEAKVINDSVAYIRSLAELRGRNADWAERAVRGAASLSAAAAQKRNVIDLVAGSVDDLLQQADGRSVEVVGQEVTLDLADANVRRIESGWRIQLLEIITNPNVALLLMAIGFYGIVFEFINPGALLPGTLGGISLLLGLYAFSALPLSVLGVALLLLGLVLMIAEAFLPSFGVLGIGGLVAFGFGATALFDTDSPAFQVAWPLVVGIAVGSLLITLIIARMALRSARREGVSGAEGLIGKRADVLDWVGDEGHVFVEGERWQANSDQPLDSGAEHVRVVALRGNTLTVDTWRDGDNPAIPDASDTERTSP